MATYHDTFDENISIEEVAELGFSDYLMLEEAAELFEDAEEEIMQSGAEDELSFMADIEEDIMQSAAEDDSSLMEEDEEDIEDMGDFVPVDPDDPDVSSFIANADFVDDEDVVSYDAMDMDEAPPSEADMVDDYIDNEMNIEEEE